MRGARHRAEEPAQGPYTLAQGLGVHAILVLFDDIRGQAKGRHQGRVAMTAVAGGGDVQPVDRVVRRVAAQYPVGSMAVGANGYPGGSLTELAAVCRG